MQEPVHKSKQCHYQSYSSPPHTCSLKKVTSFTQSIRDEEVEIINFIKSRHLSRHLFYTLCDEMGRTRVRKCCCGMSTFSGSLEKECCVCNCLSCERSKLGFFFAPCGILVPLPVINLSPFQRKHRVVTVGQPGNSQGFFFFFNETFTWKNNWQTKPSLFELEHLPNVF